MSVNPFKPERDDWLSDSDTDPFAANQAPGFYHDQGGYRVFRGSVVEATTDIDARQNLGWVSSQQRTQRLKQESWVTIQEIAFDRMPAAMVTVLFKGSVSGRVSPGREVTVYAKLRRGMYEARRIIVHDTGIELKPGWALLSAQLDPRLLMLLVGIVLVIAFALWVGSGGFASFTEAVFVGIIDLVARVAIALLPFGFLYVIYRLIFKGRK